MGLDASIIRQCEDYEELYFRNFKELHTEVINLEISKGKHYDGERGIGIIGLSKDELNNIIKNLSELVTENDPILSWEFNQLKTFIANDKSDTDYIYDFWW